MYLSVLKNMYQCTWPHVWTRYMILVSCTTVWSINEAGLCNLLHYTSSRYKVCYSFDLHSYLVRYFLISPGVLVLDKFQNACCLQFKSSTFGLMSGVWYNNMHIAYCPWVYCMWGSFKGNFWQITTDKANGVDKFWQIC